MLSTTLWNRFEVILLLTSKSETCLSREKFAIFVWELQKNPVTKAVTYYKNVQVTEVPDVKNRRFLLFKNGNLHVCFSIYL